MDLKGQADLQSEIQKAFPQCLEAKTKQIQHPQTSIITLFCIYADIALVPSYSRMKTTMCACI